MRTPTRPTVFVSYSHRDEAWKDRLRPHLGVLERIQHELERFGPDPGAKAAKNRAIFFLLRICLELEQSEQSFV